MKTNKAGLIKAKQLKNYKKLNKFNKNNQPIQIKTTKIKAFKMMTSKLKNNRLLRKKMLINMRNYHFMEREKPKKITKLLSYLLAQKNL